jgi:hypothetical protein
VQSIDFTVKQQVVTEMIKPAAHKKELGLEKNQHVDD